MSIGSDDVGDDVTGQSSETPGSRDDLRSEIHNLASLFTPDQRAFVIGLREATPKVAAMLRRHIPADARDLLHSHDAISEEGILTGFGQALADYLRSGDAPTGAVARRPTNEEPERDLLTVPHRSPASGLLARAIEDVRTSGGSVGLLIVRLDVVSEMNEAFGRRWVHDLVAQAHRRLEGSAPASAGLVRIDDGEFAIVLPGIADSDDAVSVAQRVVAGFEPPFTFKGVLLTVGIHVGVAVYPQHALDGPSLTSRASVATDTAYRHRTGCELYDPRDDPNGPRRLALASDLRETIEAGGLDVCYQPQIELATGVVRRAEALARWNHPRLGRIRPDEFIAIAEQSGDIRALTMSVLHEALRACRAWRDRGLVLGVSVNLSTRSVLDLHLAHDVATAVEQFSLPPASLTLELTERAVMDDSPHAVDVLTELDAVGVRLSCDDFGSGYSSLAHLRRLPISEIKLAKSLIDRVVVDDADEAIVRSVLALGRDLGLLTVAEGVESHDGLDRLRMLGCDMAQGFVISPALTIRQFDEWLSQRAPEELPLVEDDAPGPTAGAKARSRRPAKG